MTWFNLGFVTIMFVMSLLLAASTGSTCVSAFVDNRNYPGGPDVWINFAGAQDRANTIQAVSLIIPMSMADGLLVNCFSLESEHSLTRTCRHIGRGCCGTETW